MFRRAPKPDQLLRTALQHQQAGQLDQADQVCRNILTKDPKHADALHILGTLAAQTGRKEHAADLIRQAIAHKPNYPEAYVNLGNVLFDLGQTDEAIAAFREAVKLRPNLHLGYYNLGNALSHKREFDEAIAAFRRAIELSPDYAASHYNLGNALYQKQRFDDAVAAFRRAIELRPVHAQAYNNLGIALSEIGQRDDAIAAYQRAIALKPDFADAYGNLGTALLKTGRFDEAMSAYQRALQLTPREPSAHSNLADILFQTARFDECVIAYRAALALNPNNTQRHSNFLFMLNFHPGFSATAIAEESRLWNRLHAERLHPYIQPHSNDRDPNRRLRIGYVSPDFRDHCQALFTVPLLSNHDHQNFEIVCYSDVSCPDPLTSRLRSKADQWQSTCGLADEQLAAQIRRDRIDILVDLTMHMAHNRLPLFARKPAPVQVTWLAYPGTTGLSAIDYRLSDPYLDPPGMDESIYSERTHRLPHSFWCYDPLDGRDVPVNPLPAATSGFVTFGCLNSFFKVNDAVLRLWAEVLRAVPDSHLLFAAPPGATRQRVLQLLELQGIAPQRIHFAPRLPRQKYLELYHHIDIGLDTFPYNGHTTSLDSFWMGVPVITLVAQTIVGRAGLCELMNLNLPELIAHTPQQYVQIAAGLANDLPRLTKLRGVLRSRMQQSPLMEATRFARDIESACRQMWTHWCGQK